ncbi:branched-chain amino acid ABC transporter ATP-binding protein/permease [Achromobacter sp. GbtcB20]|uniref:branched-chain amino acid ABC transporter ATP-binding protein/permease n=1 Tax=Achromobacter sp. GbtcB20 TaxID=2824765 RepID=UPI001266AC77|nr:branched-chain amino acid ABC transporter ATP-binding protein/permease [Achromobacter sp. GbtcB20]
MQNTFQNNKLKIILAAALLLYVLPFIVDSNYIYHIAVLLCIFGGLATAWNIVGGYAGQISLGHAVFYGIGSYSSVILLSKYGWSPWIGMVIGMVISGVVAVMVSWPTFRLKGPFFSLVTIAILEVVRLLAIHDQELTGGSSGLTVPLNIGFEWMIFREIEQSYLMASAFLFVSLFVAWLIRKRKMGFYLMAIREREDAARAIGVNTVGTRIWAMVISAVLTSMIGSYYAMYLSFIDPDATFSLGVSIQIAMFALIGGLGTVFGPLLGAIVVLPIAELVRGWLSAYANGVHGAVYGLVLVLAVLWFPRGLIGSLKFFSPYVRSGAELAQEVNLDSQASTAGRDAVVPGNQPILKAEGLVKRFGGLLATNNVSLELRTGEILGLIGPNGAGKTTIFNLLSGFLRPNSGKVSLMTQGGTWEDITTPTQCARLGIGRTFQIAQPFSGLSVLENIMLGAFLHTDDIREAQQIALKVAHETGMVLYLDKAASELTVGAMKRLEVARALATRPRVLLLDEVMAGLSPTDIDQAIALIKNVRQSGVSVLLIEHQMRATMALCDRIIVVDAGSILVEGTPDEVVNNERVIEAYLGSGYKNAA